MALGALATAAACSQPMVPGSPSAVSPSASAVVRQAEFRKADVFKDYVGTPGPAVTINFTVDVASNGSIDSTGSVQLANGQCAEIWDDITPIADTVTVTEVVPAGYTASTVTTTLVSNGSTVVGPSVSGNSASGQVSNGTAGDHDTGFLVVFTNTQINIPPPPPTGDQGCTPGYWKQTQHFDSWPAPYTPNTLFSAVFENAFPGKTLDDVLGQGGGGLNALGRHTVAALLNAQSSGVAYPLTTQQIINGFNNVFPGGAYEPLKDRWAGFNELGCPLN
jgi:hypothetical protein